MYIRNLVIFSTKGTFSSRTHFAFVLMTIVCSYYILGRQGQTFLSLSPILFDFEISPTKVEPHPTTKTVQFDLNLNENIDSSPANSKQRESIWSTLLKLSTGWYSSG